MHTAVFLAAIDALSSSANYVLNDNLIFETESLYSYSRANSVLTLGFRDNKATEILSYMNNSKYLIVQIMRYISFVECVKESL